MLEDQKPVVAIWKDDWLPRSETFIFNQMNSLRRWAPVSVGVRWDRSGFEQEPDFTPYPNTTVGRARARFQLQRGATEQYSRFLHKRNARLVHAHFGSGAVRALPIARNAGLPLIATFHGNDATSLPLDNSRRGHRYRAALPHVFEYASTIVTVSDFIHNKVIELGAPPEKIVTLPIGVPWQPVEDSERRGLVLIGRLVEKKGLSVFLDALARTSEPVRSVPVQIIGDGPLDEPLRQQAERLGLQNVVFSGYLPPNDVHDALRKSAAIVVPSMVASNGDSEGLPTTVYEALRAGTPVIGSRHAGIPEAVVDGDSGLLVPEKDPGALADAISRILSDAEYRRELAQGARKRFESAFMMESLSDRLEDLYDQAADA